MRTFAKFISSAVIFGSVTALVAAPAPVTSGKLSAGDLRARASALIQQITADSRRVTYLKEQARKANDVIKLSCVNDKLVQLKAEENIADTTNDGLEAALASGSDAQGQFDQLSSTGEAIRRLREEAGVCVGEPELFKQESGNQVLHPDFPDDPTVNVFGQFFEPPAYASPYD